jgi:ubiquinone/menaquinone biosynthesis C-methylase UbiE
MNKRKQAPSRKKFFTHSFQTVGNLPHITSGSVVIEVGCGFGQTTVTLAKKFGCRVDAFDPCPHFIAQAKEYARMEGVTDRIRFHCEDIRHGLLPTARYDVAVAEGGFLMLVDDREALLKLLCRTVKPGGLLYLTDPLMIGKMTEQHLYHELLPKLHCEITASKLLPKIPWRPYFVDDITKAYNFFQQPVSVQAPSKERLGYLCITARKKGPLS